MSEFERLLEEFESNVANNPIIAECDCGPCQAGLKKREDLLAYVRKLEEEKDEI